MSSGHFHVHGPHEHAAQHDDPLAGRIAVITAIFATLGAMMGYMGGATRNHALKWGAYGVAGASAVVAVLALMHV